MSYRINFLGCDSVVRTLLSVSFFLILPHAHQIFLHPSRGEDRLGYDPGAETVPS